MERGKKRLSCCCSHRFGDMLNEARSAFLVVDASQDPRFGGKCTGHTLSPKKKKKKKNVGISIFRCQYHWGDQSHFNQILFRFFTSDKDFYHCNVLAQGSEGHFMSFTHATGECLEHLLLFNCSNPFLSSFTLKHLT